MIDARISSVEHAALLITQDLIARRLEKPKNTQEYLKIVATCLVALNNPRALAGSDVGGAAPAADVNQF